MGPQGPLRRSVDTVVVRLVDLRDRRAEDVVRDHADTAERPDDLPLPLLLRAEQRVVDALEERLPVLLAVLELADAAGQANLADGCDRRGGDVGAEPVVELLRVVDAGLGQDDGELVASVTGR